MKQISKLETGIGKGNVDAVFRGQTKSLTEAVMIVAVEDRGYQIASNAFRLQIPLFIDRRLDDANGITPDRDN